jgi:hypothetical protein
VSICDAIFNSKLAILAAFAILAEPAPAPRADLHARFPLLEIHAVPAEFVILAEFAILAEPTPAARE